MGEGVEGGGEKGESLFGGTAFQVAKINKIPEMRDAWW